MHMNDDQSMPPQSETQSFDVPHGEPPQEQQSPEVVPWSEVEKSEKQQLAGLGTKAIIAANVIVFALMALASGGESLLVPSLKTLVEWGADFGPLTLSGEYWRVFTACFIHIGFIHLAMNMYALWQVGLAVEALYGTSKFLTIYVIAGIAGSLVSLLFNPQIVSAGASGAVFGTFGAFWAYFKRHERDFDKDFVKSASRSVIILLIYNLAFGLSAPGIDNAAHIGGFLAGLVAGFALAPDVVLSKKWSWKEILRLVVILGLLAVLAHVAEQNFSVDLRPRAS